MKPKSRRKRRRGGKAGKSTRTTKSSKSSKAAAEDHYRQALEALCETYWYPLYVYIRRRGYGPDEAKDLTQSFFARLR